MAEEKKTATKVAWVITGVVSVLFVLALMIINAPAAPEASTVEEVAEVPDIAATRDPASANYAARLFVEKQLKAPATAQWPMASDGKQIYDAEADRWIVSNYVDSQNGFGALIRLHYTAKLEYLPGQGWRLDDLVTDDGK